MELNLYKQVLKKIKIYLKYLQPLVKISNKNLFNQKEIHSKKIIKILKLKTKHKKIKKRKIVNVEHYNSNILNDSLDFILFKTYTNLCYSYIYLAYLFKIYDY